MNRTAAVLLIALAAAVPAFAESPEIRSIVEVLVTSQRYDTRMPWRQERPAGRAGYGVVVADGRVLTTESLVRNAVLIEVRKPGRDNKIPARLVVSDCRLDSALLATEPHPDIQSLPPVGWAENLGAGAKVSLTQFDDAGQPQDGDGRITEVAVDALPNAPSAVLTFKVLTDLKINALGTPAFHQGKLAGLALQYDSQTQTTLVIPAPILKRFMTDAAGGSYKGVASAGLTWTALMDPAKRRFLGLKDDNTGVFVLRTIPGAPASSLFKPGDVLLDLDGKTLDSQGYYQDAVYGRLLFSHLISGCRSPGDTIPATIIRNREKMQLSLPLVVVGDDQALIPQNTEGRQPEYLVDGGLILRELTADYLMAHGPRWMLSANLRLVNLYLTRAQYPSEPGERVVILSSVLPDPINVGYQMYHDEIVTQVNGRKIRNIRDAFAIVREDGGIRRLTLSSTPLDLVLDPERLKESNQRLARVYRIPRLQFERQQP